MRRLTHSMTEFRENPEDETRTILPGSRDDEIGVAERDLAGMQKDVRAALRQKSRLATLGAAVAKINHDLRNSLATAVLVSDKLAGIDDPEVKKVMPRLYDAMDRAVDLCSQTLNYVSDGAPPMEPSHFHVQELVAEVGTALSSREAEEEGPALRWRNEVAF
jgi:signal transduction histidine kinase